MLPSPKCQGCAKGSNYRTGTNQQPPHATIKASSSSATHTNTKSERLRRTRRWSLKMPWATWVSLSCRAREARPVVETHQCPNFWGSRRTTWSIVAFSPRTTTIRVRVRIWVRTKGNRSGLKTSIKRTLSNVWKTIREVSSYSQMRKSKPLNPRNSSSYKRGRCQRTWSMRLTLSLTTTSWCQSKSSFPLALKTLSIYP